MVSDWFGLSFSLLIVLSIRPGRETSGDDPNTERDHHPFAFSMLMAGGGVKGGQVVGRTDDIGWNPVEDPIHINNFHTTILHLFRLNDVGGKVVKKLLAYTVLSHQDRTVRLQPRRGVHSCSSMQLFPER